ncbi:hypothetical protein [Polaromonas sp. YR568]|uniref:hypothetical protein n=1 Tax=Polaromonas sp. YR568 TaxID=1855301 RepID=UPI00398BCF7C
MRLLVAARLNKPSWLEGRRMMASDPNAGGGEFFCASAAGRSFWVKQAKEGVFSPFTSTSIQDAASSAAAGALAAGAGCAFSKVLNSAREMRAGIERTIACLRLSFLRHMDQAVNGGGSTCHRHDESGQATSTARYKK